MSTPKQPNRRERRDAARSERKAAEQAAAAKAQRQRRLMQLGGVAALALIVVVVAIVVSSGSGSDAPKKQAGDVVAGQSESRAMLQGIPQTGVTLGSPNAKVTMLEFADLQCPFCKEYSQQTLPQIVQNYVRNGKVKIEFRNLSFIGHDSVTAGRYAAGAAQQNKLWNVVDVFYYNQKEENSGYVSDSFLNTVGSGVSGFDSAKALAYSKQSASQNALQEANTLANKYGVTGTPTLVVGPTGGTLKKVDGFTYDDVSKALNSALGGT